MNTELTNCFSIREACMCFVQVVKLETILFNILAYKCMRIYYLKLILTKICFIFSSNGIFFRFIRFFITLECNFESFAQAAKPIFSDRT